MTQKWKSVLDISMMVFMRGALNVRWVPKRIQNMLNSFIFIFFFFILKFSTQLRYFHSNSNEDDYTCVPFLLLHSFSLSLTYWSQFALYIILFVLVSIDDVPNIFDYDQILLKRMEHRKIALREKSRWNDGNDDVKTTRKNPMPINRRINRVGWCVCVCFPYFADLAHLRTYLEM